MKKITQSIVTTAVLSTSVLAMAVPGVNSIGGGMILPEDKLVMAYKNLSFTRDTIYNGSNKTTNPMKLDAKANVNIVALRYGLGDGMDMMAIIPHKHMRAKATAVNGQDIKIDHKGLGDIVLLVNKSLANEQQDGYMFTIGAGIKLPTGKSDNNVIQDASLFGANQSAPMAVQLGTGEYEYKLIAGYTKMIQDARFDANTMYTFRSKVKNNYDFGNEFKLDLSYVKPLSNTVNLGIEYNYKNNQATNRADDLPTFANPAMKSSLPMKAFSGEVGYITPQIQYVPFGMPKIHISCGVSYLAHYDVDEAQPLEKKRVVFRVGYLF